MGKFDSPSFQPPKKPALVQFGHNLWNNLTGKNERSQTAIDNSLIKKREVIKKQSFKERRNIMSSQSINTYRAGERLSPQETAQKIRNIFGDVSSVSIPRSNGGAELAFKKSDGLYYFSGKNTPCYLGKGETVSKNTEKKEAIPASAKRVQVETQGKINKLLPWNWGKGDIRDTLLSSLGDGYYANQDKKNNCGPTACAIAAARLVKGLNPYKLRDIFTRAAPGAMSWDAPSRLLQPMGLNVQSRSSLSPSDIDSLLNQGNVILASATPKSGLTTGGHIIALTGARGANQWENSDPNIRNIQKGLGIIGPQNLMNGGAKQYWIVSRGSNAVA
ncbi:MAG: hypothetical protein WC753_03555 [Candidatus Gracilibacteria bacterium]